MNNGTTNLGDGSKMSPRPESIQVNLIDRFEKLNATLENFNSRLAVKADQLIPRSEAKTTNQSEPSPSPNCFSEKMYELLRGYERQLNAFENCIVRLEQF